MNRRHLLRRALTATGALALGQGGVTSSAQSVRNEPLIIDAHCHAGTGEALTAPWSTYADPELTLKRAQEAGISKTIIFPINNPTYERPNREIADIVRRHSGKFIGFAKHDPVKEAGNIRALLTREVQELGLKGVKLHQVPTREMLDTVAELKIPVLFHPPKTADFHMVASAYPQISFIMAHLGSFASRDWTEHLQAIDLARRYPNVFLETSSVVFFRYLELAAQELPAEKLIFGSDGPEVDSRVELHKIRLLKLPGASERKVLGENILRLLPA
ncbi:MAG: amidohydrolase family protein [Acidobacteriota bacterium]